MLTILHTNDFHGTLSRAKAEFIRDLKAQAPDTLYFDSGDAIKTGNLGVPLKPEPAWELLDCAGCDASVLGNRETHVFPNAIAAKLEGIRHPITCCNMRLKSGELAFAERLIFELAGLRVGVFGVMVPMVTERMKSKAVSAYIWDPPIPAAQRVAAALGGTVDCVIALSHIGHKQDLTLAEACPEIDVILGGHSHTVLPQPEQIGHTWICQGGSHGKFVGRYEWQDGRLTGGLLPLPAG